MTSTASLVRPRDPVTHQFVAKPKDQPPAAFGVLEGEVISGTAREFTPTRVYHLEFPGCTIVDRGVRKGLKELKDYDPAQSREFVFQDSYYQAMTPEDLEAVLRCGGASVAVEDLPEGLEIACPHCGRETRCRKFMTWHIARCTPA